MIIGIGFLFYSGQAKSILSIVYGEPNVLVICADDYYLDSHVQDFINAKTNAGYIVELKNVSQILKDFPIQQNNVNLLNVKNVEYISSSNVNYSPVAYWFDGTRWQKRSMNYLGNFVNFGSPSIAKPISVSGTEWYTLNNNIEITYDGGQKITVNAGNSFACDDWGQTYITTSGTIYRMKTAADSIHSYIFSKSSVEYVIILGGSSKVSSFDWRIAYLTSNINFVCHQSFTDTPYSVENPYNNDMTPKIAVSRIPAETQSELDIYIHKALDFKPNMSSKTAFYYHCDIVPYASYRQYIYNPNYQTLSQIFSTMKFSEIADGYDTQVVNSMNSEQDYIISLSHGSTNAIHNCYSSIDLSDVERIAFKNSTLAYVIACLTSDFSYLNGGQCIGSALLFDPDSKLTIYIGASVLSTVQTELCKRFFANIPTSKTVGNCMKDAKYSNFDESYYLNPERLDWQIFGDCTLALYETSTPPITPYGWISLSCLIDNLQTTVNVTYIIKYPNTTTLTYVGKSITIYNCPLGSYTITCVHSTLGTKISSVTVEKDIGTQLEFTYNTVPPHIYSNVIISVSGSGTTNPKDDVYTSRWYVCDSLTITVTPSDGWHFTKISENGNIYYTTEITIILKPTEQIRAYFEQDIIPPRPQNSNITIYTQYYKGIWSTINTDIHVYRDDIYLTKVTTVNGQQILQVAQNGSYRFLGQYNGISNETTISIVTGNNYEVFLYFYDQTPPPVETGTIRIRSNVQCLVNITGYSTPKSTPFDLVGIPVGTYMFTAYTLNLEGKPVAILIHTANLQNNQDIVYSFSFQGTPIQLDILGIFVNFLNTYSSYVCFAFSVLFLAKAIS